MKINGEQLTKMIESFIDKRFEGELDIYDIKIVNRGKKLVVTVFIDSDNGVTIADCERVSKELGKYLDYEDPISASYILEISSAGAERILKQEKDYRRAQGRKISLTTDKPLFEGQKKQKTYNYTGRLISYVDNVMEFEVKNERKQVPLENIIKAKTILEFPFGKKAARRGNRRKGR